MTQTNIESYLPIVDFIAETYGEYCEVVLHDLSDLNNSIVAIRNSHITGRSEEDTLTDFALEIVNNAENYEGKDFIANYRGETKDGRTLKSSTYLIRDDSDKIIGMLCVNIDITAFKEAKKSLDGFLCTNESGKSLDKQPKKETFDSNIEDLVLNEIKSTVADFGVKSNRLTVDEKKRIVKVLDEKGVFLLKGTVAKVASQLDVSKQTIYRYLNS